MNGESTGGSGTASGDRLGCAGEWRSGGWLPRLLGLFCLLVTACAHQVPAGNALPNVAGATPVRVEDERGPLGPARAAAALRRIDGKVRRSADEGENEGEGGRLSRHLAQIEGVMSAPLVLGNDAHLLIDGPQTQAAMPRAIGEARHQVDLETYILEPKGIGEELAALLENKSRGGVTVRVLYDSVGSAATPKTYFERLQAAGIAVCEFNPVNPLHLERDVKLSINNRDHRKILIVDGRVTFTGGINISSVYSSGSFGKYYKAEEQANVEGGPQSGRAAGWRDTHVAVRGPVVDQFQELFDSTWSNQRCPSATAVRTVSSVRPPVPKRAGGMAMRLVAADPLVERSELYVALLSAIENARRRMWLTYGYFVPDDRLLQSLRNAAQRGVDVRLALPGFSDFWAPFHAGRSHYSDLLDAGVRIFERRDALLHAKTAVIDSVWSSVGSTNLDWRSFVHNYEADVLVLDNGFAGELEHLFELDESASHEITEDEWKRRDIGTRFLEWLARRWEYLL
jgi:cardiolipin synthase